MQRIIHPTGDGVAVIIPAEKAGISIHEIARKDVPAGIPFRIVDEADIPSERGERGLWTADFNNPDGYGIGHEDWVAEQERAQ